MKSTSSPSLHAERPDYSTDRFCPLRIMEVELTSPLPGLDFDGQYRRAWVLARVHTEPIGVCIVEVDQEGVTPDELAGLIWEELSGPIVKRFVDARIPVPVALTGGGLESNPEAWPFLRERSAMLADPPFISVVICTRDRPEQLGRCLGRLRSQKYPRFEVVVVDNAPRSGAVQSIVAAHRADGANFRHCIEPRPGLSWARNAGIAAVAGEIIAFLDDDDEPDEYWLVGIAVGFVRSDRIGSVTGVILPARLHSRAEFLFEEVGGHGKGRGFGRETFSNSGGQSPLFPLPPFGTGANMAYRREVLNRIGGFDVALGAGTPTSAGEDTLALTLTMLAGYEIAYEPTALMWHHHREEVEDLNRQLHGYSIGLTAFYAALIIRRPSVIPGLIKLLPAALSYVRRAIVAAPAGSSGASNGLYRRHIRGMFAGPGAYVRSVFKQRRAANLE